MSKISEIFEKVVKKVPANIHGEPEMLDWLSALDGEIFDTLYMQREKPPVTEWKPYDPLTTKPDETELLVTGHYSDIYVLYLVMMIHKADAEMEMAANDTDDYNRRYLQFRSDYARSHPGITGRWNFF